jgi:hypothetical protein
MNIRAAMKTGLLVLLASTLGSVGWSTWAESQTLSARLFTTGVNNEIHFTSGAASWCVQAEPINNNFQVTDIDPCSVVLISNGTGSVSQISLDCTKPVVVGDADLNGVQDIRFCFVKTAMHPLFDNLHGRKPKTVTLTIAGNLLNGQHFSGDITLLLYLMD